MPTNDVNFAAQRPVQFNLFPASSTSATATAYYTMPASKRLVIEYISGQAQDVGSAASLTLGTQVGNRVSRMMSASIRPRPTRSTR